MRNTFVHKPCSELQCIFFKYAMCRHRLWTFSVRKHFSVTDRTNHVYYYYFLLYLIQVPSTITAYDPENDCRGIFVDWFLFPSYCVCVLSWAFLYLKQLYTIIFFFKVIHLFSQKSVNNWKNWIIIIWKNTIFTVSAIFRQSLRFFFI